MDKITDKTLDDILAGLGRDNFEEYVLQRVEEALPA